MPREIKEIYEEWFYCVSCDSTELSKNDFYTFKNKTTLFPTGFRPYCKKCLNEVFDKYLEFYNQNDAMAMDRMCQVVDLPFQLDLYESAKKSQLSMSGRGKNNYSLMPEYFKLLNSASGRKYQDMDYEDSTPLEDKFKLYIDYYQLDKYLYNKPQKQLQEEIEEIPQWLIDTGIKIENLSQPLKVYKYLLKIVPSGNTPLNEGYIRMITVSYATWISLAMKTDLSKEEVKIRDTAMKDFKNTLKDLGVDPKSISLEDIEEETLGMKIKITEQSNPADYYSSPEKMNEINKIGDGRALGNYFNKFFVRPVINYLVGSPNYENITQEDLIRFSDEDTQDKADTLLRKKEMVEHNKDIIIEDAVPQGEE